MEHDRRTPFGPKATKPAPERLSPEERVRLVERARSGDEEAFERLVRLHQRSIFLAVRQKVHSDVEAEDVAQEVFVRAFFSLPRLREPEKVVGWLHGIAQNCVLSHLERKLRRAQPVALTEDIPARGEPEPEVVVPSFLLGAIGGLPERYRQVVNLHFLEGLEHAEVARCLGIAPGTVRSRLHRAMGILRKTLERRGRP